jgi:hypothetical protein
MKLTILLFTRKSKRQVLCKFYSGQQADPLYFRPLPPLSSGTPLPLGARNRFCAFVTLTDSSVGAEAVGRGGNDNRWRVPESGQGTKARVDRDMLRDFLEADVNSSAVVKGSSLDYE